MDLKTTFDLQHHSVSLSVKDFNLTLV